MSAARPVDGLRRRSDQPPAPSDPPADGVLLAQVRRRLAHVDGVVDRGVVRAVLRDVGLVGSDGDEALVRMLGAEVSGAGPLQVLLDDPEVTDVLVNGCTGVWVDRGAGLAQVPVELGGVDAVRGLAVRLAAACGRRLDDASPTVDGRLPDGTRLHAVLPPVAPDGPLLSLRVPRRRRPDFEDLVVSGGVPTDLAPALRALVRGRANVLVSGATGTGKTTLLAALLSLVPPSERIVCIEEAQELTPDHPHVVHLVGRPPNVEGTGGVELTALVRQALRMRPDRVVLGEFRGAEVRDVLAALNTGHDGGWSTLHANAVGDVPARLEALGALAGMSPEAVRTQATSAVDAVVHLRRAGARRYVAQLGVVCGAGAGLVVRPVLEHEDDGATRIGPDWPAFARRWGLGAVGP